MAFTIRPNVRQAKWVLDYQLVRGINLVQVMFYPSSAVRIPLVLKHYKSKFLVVGR